jgi:hypothetical protein
MLASSATFAVRCQFGSSKMRRSRFASAVIVFEEKGTGGSQTMYIQELCTEYFLSITEVVEKFSLSRIVGYINSTKRFNNHHGDRN